MVCPQPPSAVNGSLEPVASRYVYNNNVTYTCDDDNYVIVGAVVDRLRHLNGRTEHVITCQQDETWSDTQIDCQRKNHVILKHHKKFMYVIRKEQKKYSVIFF